MLTLCPHLLCTAHAHVPFLLPLSSSPFIFSPVRLLPPLFFFPRSSSSPVLLLPASFSQWAKSLGVKFAGGVRALEGTHSDEFADGIVLCTFTLRPVFLNVGV